MSESFKPTSSCCPYWLGSRRKGLLHLYRTIVRSKLDYGSIVYGSVRESYLKTATIHHQGIRLALGAFWTTPADSLLVEANEPSLNDRREKLPSQFALKLKSNRSNPTYNTVFRPKYFTIFQNKPKCYPKVRYPNCSGPKFYRYMYKNSKYSSQFNT